MKRTIIILILLICLTQALSFFQLPGQGPIMDLALILISALYMKYSLILFREKNRRVLHLISGSVLVLAGLLTVLPVVFFYLNKITFILNINYNDILFNHYKAHLNCLFGFYLFILVCLVQISFSFQDHPERKENKTEFFLVGLLMIVTPFLIARGLGWHFPYTKALIKMTLFLTLLVFMPYIFHRSQNKFSVPLLLLSILILSNGISRKAMYSLDMSATKWFTYTKPVRQIHTNNLDTLKTIQSLQKLGDNFYTMTFYGDYNGILEQNNKKCLEESINPGHYCSLFSAFGDSSHYFFGRNFDNPAGWKCKTILCRTNPADGYATLALSRMADYGFDVSEDIEGLSYKRKLGLLNSVFWTPDGINEKGLVVALAAVDNQYFKGGSSKSFINCTYLVREILERAATIEEAIQVIEKYNIMNDVWSNSFDNHLLIADALGRSAVAEVYDGKFKFTFNTQPWQVLTNSPSYKVDIAKQKENCPRLKTLAEELEPAKGKVSEEKAMTLLKKIAHEYSQWSVVYDLSGKEMLVVIDYDFAKQYRFSFDPKNK